MSTPTSAGRGGATRTPTTGGRQPQERGHGGAPNSAGAASVSFRTPTTAGVGGATSGRTPGTAGGQNLPASAARTPHARAARLALDSRRTAIFTPGGRQSRRKSGRILRESPRDLLRNLSRRLAPTSQPIASSSPTTSSDGGEAGRRSRGSISMDTIPEGRAGFSASRKSYLLDDDDDDSLPLDRPRMSLPIEEDDNDDDLRPHRSMVLDDDENFTLQSIEFARRAATQEQLQQTRRFSRGSLGGSSLGSVRLSDYIEGFIGGADDDANLDQDEPVQSAFFPEGAFDNLGNERPADMTFERLDSDTGERHDALGAGGDSGFDVIDVPLDGNETTFMLGQQQSPARTLAPGLVDDAGDQGVPFDDYDGRDNNDFWIDDSDNEAEGEAVDDGIAATEAVEATEGQTAIQLARDKGPRGKRLKLSAHGIPYPSLPAGVVKRVAQTFAQASGASKAKLNAETVAALSTASDWFFEQVGVDLQRFSKHAGRKTIDESDMLILMRRQRQINATATPFSLAQRFLPRELLQELRMIPEVPTGKRRPRTQQRISTGVKSSARRIGGNVT